MQMVANGKQATEVVGGKFTSFLSPEFLHFHLFLCSFAFPAMGCNFSL